MDDTEVTYQDLTGINILRVQIWFLKALALLPEKNFSRKIQKALNVYVFFFSIVMFSQIYFSINGLGESIAERDFTTITNCVGSFAVFGSMFHKYILIKKNKDALVKIGLWAKNAAKKRGEKPSSIFLKVAKGMSLQHYFGTHTVATLWGLYPLIYKKPLLPMKYTFFPEIFSIIYSSPMNFIIYYSISEVTNYSISMFMHIMATFCDEAFNLSNDWATMEYDKKNPTLFRQHLKSLTERHVELIKISKDVQLFHDGFFGFELFVSIAVMFYTIIGISKLSDDIGTFLIVVTPLAFVVIIECFVVCWFGDQITESFKNFHRNVYNSNWVDACVGDRRSVIIVQEFTKKPMIMTGGTIFTASLATFVMAIPGNREEQDAILKQREEECFSNTTNSAGACPVIWDGILCWNETHADTYAQQPCPEYFAGFKSDSVAIKYCTTNATWFFSEYSQTFWTNYTECSSHSVKIPFPGQQPSLAARHLPVLNAISQTGYGISLASLIVAFVILASFKRLRCSRNLLHMHLFISFMLRASTSLLKDGLLFRGIGLSSHLELSENGQDLVLGEFKDNWTCKLLISLWQFSLLANYVWILMEGLYLHNLIFLALFSDTSSITIYVIVGWSLPLIFIIPWILIKIYFEDQHCWTRNSNQFYLLIISGPIAISTFVNLGLFVNIVRVLLLKLRASISEDRRRYRKWAKSTLVLIPLFGVHYALFFGMSYSIGKNEYVEVIWLYCDQLMASFQGFFVALLYCFMNGEVKTELKKRFGESRREIYSDTAYSGAVRLRRNQENCGKKGSSGNMESCMISFTSTTDYSRNCSKSPNGDIRCSLLETSLNKEDP